MTIGNYQAFVKFIGNDSVTGVGPIKNCVMQLNKICTCQKSRRASKSEECNNLYIAAVKAISTNIEYLKSKTSDESIQFYHNSHHQILNVKLR